MAAAKPESAGSDEEDVKRKFREALDRKRNAHADGTSGEASKDSSKVRSAHGPAKSKRSFRRKSGG